MVILTEKEREIEITREQLHRLVEQKLGNFTDVEVAALSRHLDQLIVEYEAACIRQKQADNLAAFK
ncbi:MAG: Spo0E like sporulation regulatory protein [Firmicutes bacterium]|nr:Spo0E like sporulation regulatory protein [Bacillota bacterium]